MFRINNRAVIDFTSLPARWFVTSKDRIFTSRSLPVLFLFNIILQHGHIVSKSSFGLK